MKNGMILALCTIACTTMAKTVQLAPGMTFLDQPMTLTEKDSHTCFVGAADGSTVLSGGARIAGWHERAPGVWAAKAPFFFESLFVNGRRAVRAREPNKGFFHVKSIATTEKGRQLVLNAPQAAKVKAVPAAELPFAQMVAHVKWSLFRRPIAGAEETANGVSVTLPQIKDASWNQLNPNEQYFIENLRSAFDAPGEWFYDGVAGEVLYRPLPGETLATIEAIAPRQGMTTLVKVDGVCDVTFENVTFAHTTPSAEKGPSTHNAFQAAIVTPALVKADRATGLAFERCAFRHTGAYAIHLENDCVSNRIVSCRFEDLGSGGVKIGPFDGRSLPGAKDPKNPVAKGAVVRPPAPTSFNVVSNCLIRAGGRFYESGIGVIIGHSSDNQVVKNTIEDFFYTGISVGWVWGYSGSYAQRNQIGYNRIRKIGQRALSDMGGIYTLGTSFGTRLYNNVISDIDAYTYGGWGLYPDEGSEGITLENNLVYDTKDASMHQHYGRNNILRNNILCFSRECQVAVTRVEPHRSMTIERNILYWQKGDAFGTRYRGIANGAKLDWSKNLWWCCAGEPRFNGKSYAEWQTGGRDAGGLVADPGFVNPAARDFRLRPGSPALKFGFKPFDPAEAGCNLTLNR